ncbi:hypothetical protein G9A89_011664 [Geosiphon pyriformis]|nr:hypothetical protein G9A89_011664 [Geosiphon pyriformis]
MNNYFLNQNIQNAFYILHKYWIKNYPNATLTIGKQITITNNNGTHTVIRPKKTTTRRERIGSKMDKYLLESITAAILIPSITIGKMIKEILPIDKNLSYGKQLELYGHLGEIIEDMKLMKKTTSEIQVEILGIIRSREISFGWTSILCTSNCGILLVDDDAIWWYDFSRSPYAALIKILLFNLNL